MAKAFRVSHAEIRLEGLGEHGSPEYFRSALEVSWVAGVQVTRYGRTWRLSKKATPDTRLWAGRMGFVKEGELSTVDWDSRVQDFVRGEASSGIIVPFIVSEDHRIVSFQLVPGEVRPKTVTSNLQALLNDQGTYLWSIKPISIRKTFETWLQSVDRIAAFNVQLTYPNPNWTGRRNVKGLMTGLGAQKVQIVARADENSSIAFESDWFKQAMDHIRQGYGKATLTGPDNVTGDESRFIETADTGGTVRIIELVTAGDDDREVSIDGLKEKQAQLISLYLEDTVVVDDEDIDELSST